MMSPYAAESSRLCLQELDSEEHLQTYHALMSNEQSMMWSTKRPTTTMQQSLDSLLSRRPSPEKPWNRIWAILLKQDDDRDSPGERERERGKERKKPLHIGNIGMPREAEIGYRIHPDYWGQGYMSEALGMFIGFWWAEEANKQYPQLFAAADPENRASTRVLLKHGFQRAELKRAHYARPFLGGGVRSDLQFFYLDRSVGER